MTFKFMGYTIGFRDPCRFETIGYIANSEPIISMFFQSPITITRTIDYDPSQEIVGDAGPVYGKTKADKETANFS